VDSVRQVGGLDVKSIAESLVGDVMKSKYEKIFEECDGNPELQMKEIGAVTEFYRKKIMDGYVDVNANYVISCQTRLCDIIEKMLADKEISKNDEVKFRLASRMGRACNLIGEMYLTIENDRVQKLPSGQQSLQAYDYDNAASTAFYKAKNIAENYYLHEIDSVANTHLGRILVAQNKFELAIEHMTAAVAGIDLNVSTVSKPHVLIEAVFALVNPYMFMNNITAAEEVLGRLEGLMAKEAVEYNFVIQMNCRLYRFTLSRVRPHPPSSY